MAGNILEMIAAHARERVAEDQKKISAEQMQEMALGLPKGRHRILKALAIPA